MRRTQSTSRAAVRPRRMTPRGTKEDVFMSTRTDLNLSVDLQHGVVPISTAASSLAALIKRANAFSQPVIITQKGYPTGVLLPIGLFTALKCLANDHDELAAPPKADAAVDAQPEVVIAPAAPADAPQEAVAPASRRPTSRRRKQVDAVA